VVSAGSKFSFKHGDQQLFWLQQQLTTITLTTTVLGVHWPGRSIIGSGNNQPSNGPANWY